MELNSLQEKMNNVIVLSDESFEKEVVNMQTLADSLIDGFILSLSKETLKNKTIITLMNRSIKECL